MSTYFDELPEELVFEIIAQMCNPFDVYRFIRLLSRDKLGDENPKKMIYYLIRKKQPNLKLKYDINHLHPIDLFNILCLIILNINYYHLINDKYSYEELNEMRYNIYLYHVVIRQSETYNELKGILIDRMQGYFVFD